MAAKKTTALTAEERLGKALVPAYEQPYEVPKNWCWTYWGKVGTFIAGTGFKNEYQGYSQYEIPFYKVGSLKYADNDYYLYDLENTVNEDIRAKLKATLIPQNSILFAKIGEAIRLNRRRLNSVPCCIDNNMMAFIPKDSCNYLYTLYWSMNVDLYDLANATTVPAIRKSDLEIVPFPLPPITEQKRIVDTITELFADLDKAAENAQAIVDGYENRKSAILHQAFTGELTEQWRAENGLDMGSWMLRSYADLGKSKLGKMLDKVKNNGIPTPYIRNVNVRWFSFDLTDVATMLASEEERKSLSVKQGDLFICEGGEPGRCAIWKDADCEMIFQKALHRFRPNEGVCSEYLGYTLHYMSLNGQLQEHFTGTTIKHLTGQALAKIKINLPSYEEQQKIVRILDELLADEQRIKEAAEEMLDKIAMMKKSILADAFRGKLGTNDPSDQPATELLKQILT